MTAALASMTGFARAEGSAAGLAWVWELRSVNGRGLDLRFRLPSGWDALEPILRTAAGQLLKLRAALRAHHRITASLVGAIVDAGGNIESHTQTLTLRLTS